MNEQQAWQQRLEQLGREVPGLFTAGQTALYVGATPWRFQMGRELFEAGYRTTLLEAFKPYAEHYQDHPWLHDVICGDVKNVREIAGERKWDVVVWWHGPEHVGKDNLAATLEGLESVATKLVVLGSPWGVNQQGMVAGNPYSVHQTHLNVGDFVGLGYNVSTLGERSNPATWCHLLGWKCLAPNAPEDLVVYTAVFGSFDRVSPPAASDVRHICFSDGPLEADGWEVRIVERRLLEARREARMYKALPHQWLPDAAVSIWQDGCIELKVHPSALVDNLGSNDIAVMEHPVPGTLADEPEAVIKLGKAPARAVAEQVARYADRGFIAGEHERIATMTVIRRHSEITERLNEAWWSELSRFTARDQLSFQYACWRTGIAYSIISNRWWPRGDVWCNDWLVWHGHQVG